MENFDHLWTRLQKNLRPGTQIRNWTAFRGYLGDDMTVAQVSDHWITIDSPNARSLQKAPRADFEAVWEVWQEYKSRQISRSALRDRTRFSKYIISILKWYETMASA